MSELQFESFVNIWLQAGNELAERRWLFSFGVCQTYPFALTLACLSFVGVIPRSPGVKSDGIPVRLPSNSSGGWANSGGMPQTNISCPSTTMIVDVIAIVYQINELEAQKSFEKIAMDLR
jgi:hypothetical protein